MDNELNPPPADHVPLEEYRPISSGVRLADEKDGPLGGAADAADLAYLWPVAAIAFLVILVLVIINET